VSPILGGLRLRTTDQDRSTRCFHPLHRHAQAKHGDAGDAFGNHGIAAAPWAADAMACASDRLAQQRNKWVTFKHGTTVGCPVAKADDDFLWHASHFRNSIDSFLSFFLVQT
jgi:hypothetical protein